MFVAMGSDSEAGAGYGANTLGVLVGEDVISTENAFYLLVALNVVAVPLGTMAMQPSPGCCAADNRNAEKRAVRPPQLPS